MPTASALADLAAVVRRGLPDAPGVQPTARQALVALFGDRYHTRHASQTEIRDAYGRTAELAHVPFAGLLPQDSNPSGPYGGMSVVWFPRPEGGSLITLVVGTLGLHPDEALLGRPGHRRRVAALRAHLGAQGVRVWTKSDPTALGASLPSVVTVDFPGHAAAFGRYGPFIYACAEIGPQTSDAQADATLAAFLDLYAYERGWQVLAAHRPAVDAYIAGLTAALFANPTTVDVTGLLQERRFVVLQGPPGTGKTRMADAIRSGPVFAGRGLPVQFHPAITYEDFVVGLAPAPTLDTLRFRIRPGWLLQAIEAAEQSSEPYLLQIDEINRGDLGKVLGEAIYLFEPGEDRQIVLPHAWREQTHLRLPENLHVLGTMNTADRSIAGMDLAVRRRFAFVTVHPDRQPIAEQGQALAVAAFDRLTRAFVEYAGDEALALLPGQAYYLADNGDALRRRLRYELLPLLDEYLTAGLLGGAAPEVQSCRDWVADALGQ